MKALLFVVAILVLSFQGSAAEQSLKTSIKGDALSINAQKTRLGAPQWKNPERSWRTVAALIKSAVPPANKDGMRPNVTLEVDLDGKAPWGAAKALFMAAASLGVTKTKISMPKKGVSVSLALPGADSKKGNVVDFPLSAGASGKVMTENGGRKMPCTPGLMKGLIKQLPKATIFVKPSNAMPASKVIEVIDGLKRTAKAAAVAYMPVVEVSAKDTADRKKTKNALDRAFGGGALGGK